MEYSDTDRDFFGSVPTSEPSPASDMSEDKIDVGADGTVDRLTKKRDPTGDRRPSMAIFVHAGAGYHSVQNENVHLATCAK